MHGPVAFRKIQSDLKKLLHDQGLAGAGIHRRRIALAGRTFRIAGHRGQAEQLATQGHPISGSLNSRWETVYMPPFAPADGHALSNMDFFHARARTSLQASGRIDRRVKDGKTT